MRKMDGGGTHVSVHLWPNGRGERDGKRARRKQSKTEKELDGKNSETAFPAAISNKKCTQLNNEKISVFSNIIGEMS